MRSISEAPAPLNVTQLRSFLGVVSYYSKFLPNPSTMLAPLYRLLQKQTKWIWEAEQDKAFHEAKTHLTSECLLIHYDPQKELVLSCDASPYGVGAVLSHRLQDGSERPVAFASRSLAPSRKRLCPTGQGSTVNSFWCKEVQPIPIGLKIYYTF